MEPNSSLPTPTPSDTEVKPTEDTTGPEQPGLNEDNFVVAEPPVGSTVTELGTGASVPLSAPTTDSSTTPLPPTTDVVTSTTPIVVPTPGTVASAPKKNQKILLIVLIVVVLVIVGLVMYMFASK